MKIAIEVPEHIIDGVLSSAFDNAGIGYWASCPDGYDYQRMLAGKEAINVHDREAGTSHSLTQSKLKKGLIAMAAKAPHQFGQMLKGDGDMNTGDVLVQCALFGDLIYG